MKKEVLRSIKPYWFYLICEGIKTDEIGKNRPQDEDWNGVTHLYCSKDMKSFNLIPDKHKEKYRAFLGKVGAMFVCDKIEEFTTDYRRNEKQVQRIINQSRVSFYDLVEYEANSRCLYDWHVSNLVVYDKPKELSEFYRICEKDCYSDCPYLYTESTPSNREEWCKVDGQIPITRPPQSWFYVVSKAN